MNSSKKRIAGPVVLLLATLSSPSLFAGQQTPESAANAEKIRKQKAPDVQLPPKQSCYPTGVSTDGGVTGNCETPAPKKTKEIKK